MKHIRRTLEDLLQCIAERRAIARQRSAFPEQQIPGLNQLNDVMKALKWPPEQFYDTRSLKYHQRADWYQTNSHVMMFYYYFYKELKKRNVPVYAHTVWRSPSLQLDLFNKGRSTLRLGAHQNGGAIDIVHCDYHWFDNRPTPEFWQYMGVIGKEVARRHKLPIEWGGDWKSFPDPAHWQHTGWRSLTTVNDHSDPVRYMPQALKAAVIDRGVLM